MLRETVKASQFFSAECPPTSECIDTTYTFQCFTGLRDAVYDDRIITCCFHGSIYLQNLLLSICCCSHGRFSYNFVTCVLRDVKVLHIRFAGKSSKHSTTRRCLQSENFVSLITDIGFIGRHELVHCFRNYLQYEGGSRVHYALSLARKTYYLV